MNPGQLDQKDGEEKRRVSGARVHSYRLRAREEGAKGGRGRENKGRETDWYLYS